MNARIARRLLLSLLAILSTSGAFAGKEGFGSIKLMVELERRRMPEVQVMGTRLSVRPSSGSSMSFIQDKLIEALENEMMSNDPDLELEPEHPQTVVELTVRDNRFSTSKSTVDKRMVRPMYNIPTRKHFSPGTYTTITHDLTVAYKARDLTTEASLDEDIVDWKFERTYDDSATLPSRLWLEETAIAWVVRQIARRLTPGTETIRVLLPKGSLKGPGQQAKSGSWDRYLEELAGLPARADPVDDSYRQFALGVANEALGNAATDPNVALDYLDKAEGYFRAAIAANPDEEYFTSLYKSKIVDIEYNERTWTSEVTPRLAFPPLNRLHQARAEYQKILDLRAARKEWSASLAGTGGTADKRMGDVLTNAAIIKMTGAGLSEQVILTAIEIAAATDFDVSPHGLLALAEAQVSTKVIERMQVDATRAATVGGIAEIGSAAQVSAEHLVTPVTIPEATTVSSTIAPAHPVTPQSTPAAVTAPPPRPATAPTPEPAIVGTYFCSWGAEFNVDPEEAEVAIDGKVIGIADDWDGSGGGQVYYFQEPGTYYARFTRDRYETTWVKIIVRSGAETIADIDTEMKKLRKR